MPGNARFGRLSGLNLALCAVNLAEASSDQMEPSGVAQIYATAAVSMRIISPTYFQLFTVSFIVKLILCLPRKVPENFLMLVCGMVLCIFLLLFCSVSSYLVQGK